jgi:malonate decarboxylase delta subunit
MVTSFGSARPLAEALIYLREQFFWKRSRRNHFLVRGIRLQTFYFEFRAGLKQLRREVQVGVVCSGNLEVLLEPTTNDRSSVRVRTNVSGHQQTWAAVLARFFDRHDIAAAIEINDGGASPPVVLLRLEQALEESLK